MILTLTYYNDLLPHSNIQFDHPESHRLHRTVLSEEKNLFELTLH